MCVLMQPLSVWRASTVTEGSPRYQILHDLFAFCSSATSWQLVMHDFSHCQDFGQHFLFVILHSCLRALGESLPYLSSSLPGVKLWISFFAILA